MDDGADRLHHRTRHEIGGHGSKRRHAEEKHEDRGHECSAPHAGEADHDADAERGDCEDWIEVQEYLQASHPLLLGWSGFSCGRLRITRHWASKGIRTSYRAASVPPPIPRNLPAHLECAPENGLHTSGHASWPHVVDLMEWIKSSTRTQGSRYGR